MIMYNQTGEAVVMLKERSQSLRYRNVQRGSLKLYSRRLDQDGIPILSYFEEGLDYGVDWQEGTVWRTENSRIPDWSSHIFYGKNRFDQTGMSEFSNEPYTVYADYSYASLTPADNGKAGACAAILPACSARHEQREQISYVVYGDSISTGAEASEHRFAYSFRLYQHLQRLFLNSSVEYHMKAIGGETSRDGMNRLLRDVVPMKPQLVTLAYGMNDQNRMLPDRNDVPVHEYVSNIRKMIDTLKEQLEVDIILVTPCAPNPLWKFSSGEIGEYAEALRNLGREYNLPVADVYRLWMEEIEAGKSYESLLLNNINHPNDYGHSVYEQAFLKLLSE
ncbi:hypothetical protein Back11_44310 [Paenibacillus baekrokdamisoli]|uniref:SGNH hydrolase-type esterase domain-containing protein n=1 Tax=Paenibacillus baekrokdamisoli TaxID=1712516 RepID=A0A3G9IX30_9BACL|nr:SGNH/GDSL hydrolase family protein [Paenibacillus baekrokdamisoli]MBB3067868.1 lysophospholipase L1-like esterase [Paenibacillus baekrokdamisoli]BBH23086.1 hypothetical protein Back11_44310 [Paenibacillus baekrokdamisoli]